MSRISLFPRQSRLSRAVRGALAILALGAVASAWAAGAGDLPASAAGGPAPLTVTVQPGQSLNDLAKAATQSHDPAVLARAGRALFDANPQAFMKRDPSRLKVGATLTVPALDATGAALAPAGASAASGVSGASAANAASGTAAIAQHGASAPHQGSAPQVTPAAPAVSVAHPAPVSGASGTSGTSAAGASAPIGASAAHGASTVEAVPPATPAAGASGPHVWSGSIQSAPSSASEASVSPAPGGMAHGMHEPSAAAPVAAASQPRPSSLQQLLALKNRVLMELQKHGIGKPAATNNVAPAPAPAPSAPRPAANDAGASAAAPSPAASEAASGVAASAVQPASAPVQPAVPVTSAAPARTSQQIDWRPAAAAGAAVIVLAAWFARRKRRKARRADDVTPVPGGSAAPDAGASTSPAEPLPPILPETPLARDAAGDVSLVTAAAAAAETVDTHVTEVSSVPETANPYDAPSEAPSADTAPDSDAAPAPHDVKPVAQAPAETPTEAPAAPATHDAQHAALMQNAISALNSLDMPLPPRTADEPAADAAHADSEQIATNGQPAQHPPVGADDLPPKHQADHDDEFDWEPDAATAAAGTGGGASAPSSLPPLGGAQFGALKLDFDLDLPSTPGAVLPALTPEELARIARNKLDLASEYVELGDLSGARTLLQEVIDANDAATRDDARALLAKLADRA